MLRNRTLAIGARLVAPDVLMGMYEVSEVSDAGISFDEQGDPVIIR